MILSWSQLGYWRLKIELGTIASLPLIGTILRDILTGGGGINTTTIVHFYTIHSYILSVIAVSLSVVHLVALVIQEQQQQSIFLQQLEKLVTPKCSEKQQTNSENTTQV
jgi:cytochrome b6